MLKLGRSLVIVSSQEEIFWCFRGNASSVLVLPLDFTAYLRRNGDVAWVTSGISGPFPT
ncbi:uncharacterized protein J3R85_009180 [Psidium guajava]|nr:uncharacterized protein J3R85_009180 [Psidium guajava]